MAPALRMMRNVPVEFAKVLHTWVTEAVLPKVRVLTESKARVPATARDLLQVECAKETFLRICHYEVVLGADAKVQVKRNLALLILQVPCLRFEDCSKAWII